MRTTGVARPPRLSLLNAAIILSLAAMMILAGASAGRCENGSAPEISKRRYSYTEKRNVLWESNRPLEIFETKGSIDIKGKSGNEITIAAIKTAWAKSLSDARKTAEMVRVSIEAPRDKLTIMTTPGAGADPENVYADYSLQAPRAMSIMAETEEGEISIAKMDGAVDAQTSSGPVKLLSVKGEVDVRTASGTVETENCPALKNIETAGGDIRVKLPKSSTSQEIRLATKNGNIFLDLEQNLAATVFVSPTEGEIHADNLLYVPASIKESSDGAGSKAYKVGGGGISIYIKTESGDVTLGTYSPTERRPPVIEQPFEEENEE